VLAVSGDGQMQVKNNRDETVMQVTSEGKTEIADSLTVRALENTSSDESSLVGVDKNGTLVKANLDLMQQGLIFYPVGKNIADFIIGHQQANLEDTLQTGIDIESLAGITIPDQATHILIRAALNVNFRGSSPTNPSLNLQTNLYVDGQGELNRIIRRDHQVCHVDGNMSYVEQSHTINGSTITFIDRVRDEEQQAENTRVMELPADKTFSYYIHAHEYNSEEPSINFFESFIVDFWLEGYFVPLAELLE
jgi:hypothetical protein